MNIAIHTCSQGILSVHLPFIQEDSYKKDTIFDFVSKLKITVSGPYPLGKTLAQEIQSYLQGENFKFSDYPVIWNKTTTFCKLVLSNLGHIPYGKTLSYSELAMIIGCPSAIRAVGQALKRNPWPILFPCHRVIGKNGQLKGFSSGIAWKGILLNIEKFAKGVNR